MKARIPAIEANAQEIYIRIIPLEISLKSGAREAKTSYRLFLQKGLQVLGKSLIIEAPTKNKKTQFDLTIPENNFDFQLLSEKTSGYQFVLYQIHDNEQEERVQSLPLDFTAQYKTFISQKKSVYDKDTFFKSTQLTLKWKLYISNVFDSIKLLTNGLIQETVLEEKKAHKSEQVLNNYSKKNKLKQIQEVPQENASSHVRASDPEVIESHVTKPIIQEQIEEKQVKAERAPSPPPEPPMEERKEEKTAQKAELTEKIENEPEIEQKPKAASPKMKKIVMIIVVMLILMGLMGSGIIPVGKKPKSKKKSKNKNRQQ